MRHLVRIITRLNLGGPARQIEALTPLLHARGFQTTVLYGPSGAREDSLIEPIRAAGAAMESIDSLCREPSLLDVVEVRSELRRALRRLQPDLVHTHTAKAGWHGRMLARAERIPVVHTFHGHLLEGYFGAFKSWAYRRIERRATACSALSICVAERVRQDLFQAGILDLARSVVIHPGIDVKRFTAQASHPPLSGAEPQLLFVGRLVEIKRPLAFVRLIAALRERGHGVRAKLLGDGPLREAVWDEIRALRLQDWVRVLDTTVDPSVHIAAADLLINTSRNEGLPLSVIEAQVAGRVVVATDVGGTSEAVQHQRNGILVPAEDPLALCSAVAALLRDPQQAQRLAAQGALDAREHFSAERSAAEHAAVYERVAGGV